MDALSTPLVIGQLSIPERIVIVQQIWDSIAAREEEIPVTAPQREELDRRLEEYHRSPDEGSPWEEVKARLRGRP